MQTCSARATVTPSGSRSEERRMHAQRGGHAFRSGRRNHFAILCLAPDFYAPRPSVFAAGFLQAVPHSAAPPCVLIPSFRLYGSTRLTVRANHGDGLIFPPQASNEKTPPRGPTARRGVVSPRRKEGHHPPGRLAACFHQSGWLSVRFATLEPGNRFDYPHGWSCHLPRRRGRRVPT
jgi:hypothetical protein